MVVFTNSLLSMASEYSNTAGRTILASQIDRQSSKNKQQPKKLAKQKKCATIKKKIMKMDANQQAENLIMNTKYSDDSNEFHDKNEKSQNSCTSPQLNGDSSSIPYDKNDNKLSNMPDILSMVLSLKKNALMHDPHVIQFLSAIR